MEKAKYQSLSQRQPASGAEAVGTDIQPHQVGLTLPTPLYGTVWHGIVWCGIRRHVYE